MSTIIWCDHIKHVVQEPRSAVAEIINRVQSPDPLGNDIEPRGFAFFTVHGDQISEHHQRALNVHLISSFEASPGEPI